MARAGGGRKPEEGDPYTALLPPTPQEEVIVVISPERPAGEAIPVPPFAGIIPYAGKDQKAPENTRKPRKRKNRSVSNNP